MPQLDDHDLANGHETNVADLHGVGGDGVTVTKILDPVMIKRPLDGIDGIHVQPVFKPHRAWMGDDELSWRLIVEGIEQEGKRIWADRYQFLERQTARQAVVGEHHSPDLLLAGKGSEGGAAERRGQSEVRCIQIGERCD
jgi:hypothetical protein